ncbi:uncharacterized protein LOC134242644 [Saccostrea cucullata]|uniref:uncharacterized protein LOC134242644 n=1 Tax=Saccostrea cuccullata TaxID=36930 RepID=UPI002ED0E44C
MEFQRLSSGYPRSFHTAFDTVSEIKGPIASLCGVPRHCVDIVDLEEGLIYENSRGILNLPRPIQVMIGANERRIPFYLVTTEVDMIEQDPDDEEPRLKMSCGHAITPYNLFGHMRDTLMNKVRHSICCLTPGCLQEWSFREVAQKADTTEDERIFFEYKISLNAILQGNGETSECPNCGQFCQRQQNSKAVHCTRCASKGLDKQFDFCWDCKSPWIPNHVCGNKDLEAIQKLLNDAPKKTLDYSKIENVPSKRLCPNCRTLIEHEKMCKQMRCPSCKSEFCFSCLTLCVNQRLQCSGYSTQCKVAPVQNVFTT